MQSSFLIARIKKKFLNYSEDYLKMMSKSQQTFQEKLSIERKLLPVNLLVFFFYAGVDSCVHYLNLHAKFIGLSTAEIAIINTFILIISMLLTVISGIAVDKFGHYKRVIAFLLIMSGISINFLTLVPARNKSLYKLTDNETNIYIINDMKNKYLLSFRLQENCTTTACTQQYKFIIKENQCTFPDLIRSLNTSNINSLNSWSEINLISNHEICNVTLVENFHDIFENNKTIDCFYFIEDIKTLKAFCYYINSCNRMLSLNCSRKTNSFENKSTVLQDVNIDITFIFTFIIRLSATIFLFPVFSLLDSTIWATFKKLGHGKYGRTSMWNTAARITFPFLSGLILDATSTRLGQTQYWPIYALSAGLFLLATGIMLKIDLVEEKFEGNVLTNMRQIMKLKHLLFYIITFIFGLTPGLITVFLPLFLRAELNSPMTLIGLMPAASGVPAIFLLFFSDAIIKRLGHFNVIAFGFFIGGIRLLLYSILWSPWWTIFIEILKVFSQYLCLVAFFSYGKIITSPGVVTTMSSFIRLLIYGCGRSAGVALGGIMIENWRERKTFQILSIGLFIMSITCIGIQYFYNKHRIINKQDDVNVNETMIEEKISLPDNPEKI